MKEHQQKALFSFMNEASKISEVMECYHMTGAFDILLKVCVKDMEEYTAVISNKLSNLPFVGTIQSVFVLTEAKRELGYDIQ
ncbi:Lrp/AsnC ligand binding domain-containing protein [Chryseobacterium sp. MYb328]|uniref:Lrp/AsnC ligand binding domain-containing protein n=1 Tax=Chryseobacterium sp. MYb328 TaxID=2745231 RepID=UPI0030ACAFA7